MGAMSDEPTYRSETVLRACLRMESKYLSLGDFCAVHPLVKEGDCNDTRFVLFNRLYNMLLRGHHPVLWLDKHGECEIFDVTLDSKGNVNVFYYLPDDVYSPKRVLTIGKRDHVSSHRSGALTDAVYNLHVVTDMFGYPLEVIYLVWDASEERCEQIDKFYQECAVEANERARQSVAKFRNA